VGTTPEYHDTYFENVALGSIDDVLHISPAAWDFGTGDFTILIDGEPTVDPAGVIWDNSGNYNGPGVVMGPDGFSSVIDEGYAHEIDVLVPGLVSDNNRHWYALSRGDGNITYSVEGLTPVSQPATGLGSVGSTGNSYFCVLVGGRFYGGAVFVGAALSDEDLSAAVNALRS
jgi:hypothetical protein